MPLVWGPHLENHCSLLPYERSSAASEKVQIHPVISGKLSLMLYFPLTIGHAGDQLAQGWSIPSPYPSILIKAA